jgi:S1-C subfamily serine protease
MRVNVSSFIALISIAVILSILSAQVHALTPAQVFDKVKDSVVVVITLDEKGKIKDQGSGVLLSSGKIATNCHIVEGGISYRVGRGKEFVAATLCSEEGNRDICILNVKEFRGKPAQIGKAVSLKSGDPIYAVGALQGLDISISEGIVVQLQGGPPPLFLIQITADVSSGSSGGGLFDGEGRLVGLTLVGRQKLNFAMPVEWIGVKPDQKPAIERPDRIDR